MGDGFDSRFDVAAVFGDTSKVTTALKWIAVKTR